MNEDKRKTAQPQGLDQPTRNSKAAKHQVASVTRQDNHPARSSVTRPHAGAYRTVEVMRMLFKSELTRMTEVLEGIREDGRRTSETEDRLVCEMNGLQGTVAALAASNHALENASTELSRLNDQFYEQNVVEPLTRSIFPIYDMVQSVTEESDGAPTDSLNLLAAILVGIEDFLGTYAIEPFRHDVGARFDPELMRALQDVPTDDPALDMTLSRSCKCGFRKGDRILRPEPVLVYRFQARAPGAQAQRVTGTQPNTKL